MADLTEAEPVDSTWMLVTALVFGAVNGITHGVWQSFGCVVLIALLGLVAWRFASGGERGRTNAGSFAAVFVGLATMPVIALCDPQVITTPSPATWVVRIVEVATMGLLVTYLPFAKVTSERARTGRFYVFAMLMVVLGVAILYLAPAPTIDVWTIQTRGAEALLEGHNPYVVASVQDTDPENSFTVPYVYPPSAIYLGVLGTVMGHDVRWGLLVAIVMTGFALRMIARRGKRLGNPLFEDAPALAFWLTPLLARVLQMAWLDPLQIGLITVGVAAFVGGRKTLAAIVLGVAISSKQSMFWLVPLAWLVLRLDFRRFVLMGIAAIVPVLPFAIWNVRALKRCTFDFMAGLPPRHDALSFTNAMWQWFHVDFSGAFGFVLAAVVVGIACVRRRQRSPQAFAMAAMLAYFVFFFFNRWAFANYYFLLTGLSALAAATARNFSTSPPEKPVVPGGQ